MELPMQIIKDIQQGSPEWLQLRLGVATASNFDKIIKANITKDEIVENVNFHMKKIIQKLNTRTRHEYKFTPNNIF